MPVVEIIKAVSGLPIVKTVGGRQPLWRLGVPPKQPAKLPAKELVETTAEAIGKLPIARPP